MTMEEFEQNSWYTLTNTIKIPFTELSISHCGFETKTNENDLIRNHYPAYRLHYIAKGSMYFYIGGREIFLPSGSCFLIRPDMDVSCKTNKNDPASHYWISFNGQNAKSYVVEMGFSAETPAIVIPDKYREEIHEAFYNCLNFPKQQIKFTDMIFIENFMKIARFLAVITDFGEQQMKKVPVYIERALSYFDEHYTEPDFTIRAVAQELFIHENYLSAIFKAHMGISFKHYLCRRRTDLALSLIAQGYTSVNTIAKMVGIPDPSYFTKFFKHYNGKLPSEEIKKAQSTNTPPPKNEGPAP